MLAPDAGGIVGTLERFWNLAGEPDGEKARLRDFRRFLLCYAAVRSWLWLSVSPIETPTLPIVALIATVGAGLVFRPRWERRAPMVTLVAVSAAVVWRFPYTANHLFLEWLCVALLCLDGGRKPDRTLVLGALRWTTAVVLFQTGLQKALYGHYWRGDFLAFMIGSEDRFARAFRWILSDPEVSRLKSLDRAQTGAGPYRVGFGPFVAASAGVVIAELGIPALMMHPRTRRLGAVAALALMLSIQVAALELGFALLFVNLLALFLPAVWSRRFLLAALLVWVYSLGAAVGLLPGHPGDWNLL